MQHGILSYKDVVPMLQAMRASDVVPLVRVPWLEAGTIMKVLDAGSYGVICPMINNRQQAEQLVSFVRYPPEGCRSFGPTRAVFSAGTNYVKEANQQILCIAMIETAEAMKNLDEIVSTPGLDAVYIGPADLTLGITKGRLAPHFDREEDEMVKAINKILTAAHSADIYAAVHCGTPEYAAKAIGWGFNMVTISNDVQLLSNAASNSVDRTRELIDE
jgi:4-hydroxy-2-oxoheptanedioate aldolase